MRFVETIRLTRRRLPHWEVEQGRYFVTVRCADSLPAPVLARLVDIQRGMAQIVPQSAPFLAAQHQLFRTLDKHLDAGFGSCPLRVPAAAAVVVEELAALADWRITCLTAVAFVHSQAGRAQTCPTEMRIIVQRVSSASVTVAGRDRGRIERGLLVLVGVEAGDTAADGEWLAQKLVKLRLFDVADGNMNKSVTDIGGDIQLVSQFTLHASTQKGTRPSFNKAARPEHAWPLYEKLAAQLTAALGRPVATGEFGALMQVALVNDGPVTLVIDSKLRE